TCHAATALTSACRTRASSSANARARWEPGDPSTPTTIVLLMTRSFGWFRFRFSSAGPRAASGGMRIRFAADYGCPGRPAPRAWMCARQRPTADHVDARHHDRGPHHAARRPQEAPPPVAYTTPRSAQTETPPPLTAATRGGSEESARLSRPGPAGMGVRPGSDHPPADRRDRPHRLV